MSYNKSQHVSVVQTGYEDKSTTSVYQTFHLDNPIKF